MELSVYTRLLRRWLFLIVLVAITSGSVSYYVTRQQRLEYQATATMQVGTYLNLPNPSASLISTGEVLAQTYIALLKTAPVLRATIDKLKLPLSPNGLSNLIQTRLIPGTTLLTITVTYTNPDLVAAIANELTAQLIANSPSGLTEELKKQLDTVKNEMAEAQNNLQRAREELRTIDEALNTGTLPDDRGIVLTARRNELMSQILITQSSLAQLSSTAVSLQQEGISNSLRIIDPASTSTAIAPPIVNNTLLAAVFGAVFAVGMILLSERLNGTIRSPAEVRAHLMVACIGTVAPFGRKRNYRKKLVAWLKPESTFAESYRTLRVSLLRTEKNQHGYRSYIVTSAQPGEGKSVTAANLAVTFASAGMRVLLIDADLRQPTQHRLFGLPNECGFSSVLNEISQARMRQLVQPGAGPQHNGEDPNNEAEEAQNKGLQTLQVEGAVAPGSPNGTLRETGESRVSLLSVVQQTEIPGLAVITSGPKPLNPAELLSTDQLEDLVHRAVNDKHFEIVIFDTPPVLAVSDTCGLASVTASPVVLVVEAGRTRRAAAARAIERLKELSIPLIGVVLNRLKPGYVEQSYGAVPYGTRLLAEGEVSRTKPELLSTQHETLLDVVSTKQADLSELMSALDALSKRLETSPSQTSDVHAVKELPSTPTKELPNGPTRKGTKELTSTSGRPTVPQTMPEGTITMFIGNHHSPLVARVDPQITLGRNAPEDGGAAHIDLTPYDAYKKGVSRVHIAIRRKGENFEIEDLNSANGTFINAYSLAPHEQYPLKNGDIVRLGRLPIQMFFLTKEEKAANQS
jgi:Mrp family chromosome partitioning ATPase/capsular polysaccharide biosynthesis protein